MSRFARTLLTLACALAASAAHAQYKWIDADGRVNYSDQPPPATAKKVIPLKGAAAEGSVEVTLPFAVQQAARNFPVVLYTDDKCEPCSKGREHLRLRGIPYAEKTVTTAADLEELKKAGGSDRLPFLRVGRYTSTGYAGPEWDGLLDAAGYPRTNSLPRTYQPPTAQPAAGAPAPASDQQTATTPAEGTPR